MTGKPLVIVGDSSFAEIAYEYFRYDSEYSVVAFAVEKEYLKRTSLLGLPVVAFEDLPDKYPADTHEVFVAIVYTQLNRLRTRLAERASELGYSLASYISSRSFVWHNVEMGEHCFVFEDNTIQPFVKMGDNVILWSGNHIGHHSIVGDNCFISSHVVISGHCNIGANCFFGVNSTLSNNISVGEDVVLGAGALLNKDAEPDRVYTGVPASPSKASSRRYYKVG